jgi:DNA polymerase-3 subunit delta'
MSLEKIIGQDKVIKFLKVSIENNKLVNAYLFIGPEGVGKTLTAKEFAKLLNCQNNNLNVCDNCNSCVKIEKEIHPDIHWIRKDRSGFIKIEHIRQLEKAINLRPFEAKTKVFVIEEAHIMTAQAANALLKTLEEPPGDSILILTTNSINKLFSTIVSRCQKIFFSVINVEKLKSILKSNYNIDGITSHFLSCFSEGRLGKALSINQRDILKKKNIVIDSFISLNDTVENYFNLDLKNKQDIKYNLDILISWFRDILLLKCGIEITKLINADRDKDLRHFKDKYKVEELLEIIQQILNSYMMLEYNLNPKIFLEFLRLKSWEK